MTEAERALTLLEGLEGEYSDRADDPGNWTGGEVGAGVLRGTKFGISAASYPNLDIRNLTLEQAQRIYIRDYWEPVAAKVPAGQMRLLVFDSGVQHGVRRALRWYRDHPLFADYVAHRMRFYTRLVGMFPVYGRGWMIRLATVIDASNDHLVADATRAYVLDERPWHVQLLEALGGRSRAAWALSTDEGVGPLLRLSPW